MTNATMSRQYPIHQPTHFRGKVLLLLAVLGLGGLIGIAYFLKNRSTTGGQVEAAGENAPWPSWLKQQAKYEPAKATPAPVAAPERDLNAERWAQIQQELAEQRAMLEALKRQPAKAPASAPAPPAPKTKQAGMLFLTPPSPKQDTGEASPVVPTYTLAPGTKIPCSLETAMNSDVPGYFTAKTRVAVSDTATGQQLLIPQNSMIVGHNQSQKLLYGNERLDTISLTLSLPDGRSVDIGEAPVADQQGIAGLTGKVNNHWWRLLGAVVVTGALKGGAQVAQTAMAGASGADVVVGGIAQQGSTTGQQVMGRRMDTRPTIEVDAGQLCTVILIKPLQLPAFHS